MGKQNTSRGAVPASSRRYGPEFKRDAVALLHSSGRAIAAVAKEIGVSDVTLAAWAYDASKAALNHLIRELGIKLSPHVRVNGIAPATVVAGSTMFPRDRVMQSLQKYKIEFSENETTEELRGKLADFYAQRTLTKRPILPQDCANAIVWLAGDQSGKTTGHVIPVDGGLSEASLR